VLTLCLGTGLLFLVIDGLLTAVGQSGVAPAALASWAAPVIFAAGAGTALLFMEG
jgi:lipopolysaccharide export system permease protein